MVGTTAKTGLTSDSVEPVWFACQPGGGRCIHRDWSLELGDGAACLFKTNKRGDVALFERSEGLGTLAALVGVMPDAAIPGPLFCGLGGRERACWHRVASI